MQLLLFILLTVLMPQDPADQIIGEYWTEGQNGKIAIYKCRGSYCGKIIWRKETGKDSNNPDPTKRDRSLVGIEFMKDFTYNSNRKTWQGGSVYSIDNGNTYSGKMWLEDEGKTLKMRGYIGISLLGRTATLQRISD